MEQENIHHKKHMSRRVLLAILFVAVILSLAIIAGVIKFYGYYHSPERFMNKAQTYAEAGRNQAAADQYRRALRYAKNDTLRRSILEAIITQLKQTPAQTPADVIQNSRQLLDLYANTFQISNTQQTAERLIAFNVALSEALNSKAQWEQLKQTVDFVLRLDENNPTAKKYELITKLLLKQNPDESFFFDMEKQFRNAHEEKLFDADLAYYEALTLFQHAALINQEYMTKRRNEILNQAIAVMNSYATEQPDEIAAEIYRLEILSRALFLAPSAENLEQFNQSYNTLWNQFSNEINEKQRKKAFDFANVNMRMTRLLKTRQRQNDDVMLKKLDPESFKKRAMIILAKLTANDAIDMTAMQAWIALAQIQQLERNAKGALLAMEKALDDKFKFKPGAQAMVAWHNQLQSRFTRMDLWLEEYEETAEQDLLNKVTEELTVLKKHIGDENIYTKVVEAKMEYLQKRYWTALKILTHAEREYNRSIPQAAFVAGMCFFELNEIGASIQNLAQFVNNPTTDLDQRATALMTIAKCMLRLRNFNNGIDIAEKVLEMLPEHEEAILVLAQARLLKQATERSTSKNDNEEPDKPQDDTIALLTPLTKAGNTEAVIMTAQILNSQNKHEQAEQTLIAQVQKHPDDLQALAVLYNLLDARDRQQDANKWLRQALDAMPDHILVKTMIAQALDGKQALLENAARLLATAAIDEPATRLLETFQLATALEEKEVAETAEQKIKQLDDDNRQKQTLFWHQALASNDILAAEKIAAEASRIPEMEFTATIWQAQLDLNNQLPDKALVRINRLLQEYPPSSMSHTLLGTAYQMKDDLRQAQENLEQAVRLRPDNTAAMRSLINVCINRGFNYQAMQYMRQALRFAPNDENLIRVFLKYMENYESAEQALQLRTQLAQSNPDDRENNLEIAKLMIRTRRFDQAQELINSLIAQNPTDFNAVTIKSQLLAIQDNKDQALTNLNEFLQNHPKQANAENWTRVAELMEWMGEPAQKIQATLEHAMNADGNANVPKLYLAQWHMRKGEMNKAIKIFDEIYATTKDPNLLLQKTEACLITQNILEAEKTLDLFFSIADTSRNDRAGLLKARLEIMKNNEKNAYDILTKVIENAPGIEESYLLRAQLVWENPDLTQSKTQIEDDLQKVLELNPRSNAARYLLAQLLSAKGQNAQAINLVKQLLIADKNNNQYYEMLARLYLAEGEFARLNELISEWNDVAPPQLMPQIEIWHGRLNKALGKYKLAAEHFAQAYEKAPQNIVALNEYIAALLEIKDYNQVEQVFQTAGEQIRETPQILMNTAIAKARLDDPVKAVPLFNDAFKNSEANPRLQYIVLTNAKQALPEEEWTTLLSLAEPMDENQVTALFKAMGLADAGNVENAMLALDEVRKSLNSKNPMYLQTVMAMGNLAIQHNEHEKAKHAFSLALEVMPEDPSILNNLAYEMANLNDRPFKAVELAEKALQLLENENIEARANILDTLGYAQYKAGLSAYAETTLLRSLRIQEIPAAHFHLAQVYLDQGRPKKALAQLDELPAEIHMQKGMEKLSSDSEAIRRQATEMLEKIKQQQQKNQEQQLDDVK